MTRAQRSFAELARRWAERPATPPRDWLPPAPDWFGGTPRLAPTRVGADVLWKEGRPVWGWILMANELVWQPGKGSYPGEVLWSDDPYIERFPLALESVSERFWELKRAETQAAGLRALNAFAADEHGCTTRAPFPTLLSGGRVVWHATILLYREHLPGGRLVEPWVPLVRVPNGHPPVVMTPPRAYWPDDLVESWERSARA